MNPNLKDNYTKLETESKSDEILKKFIEILTSSGNEIKRALEVINDMTSQTNLLSINAAISASKSNDRGAEFGIIAKEMHKLSIESANSASEIEGLVMKMQNDVRTTYEQIEQLEKEEEDRRRLATTLDSLKEQNKLFNQVLDHVESKVEVKDHLGKFYLINKAVANDYGHPAADIVGKDDFAFYSHEIASEYWESEKKIISKGEEIISLERVILNDLTKYWLIKKLPIFLPEYNDWGLLVVQTQVEENYILDQEYLDRLRLIYSNIEFKI